MNNIAIFNFKDNEVRTVMIDNEPYFVGKDVATALKYTNTPKAIRDHVDDEDKLTERIVLSGQYRETVLINESGLYALIFGSKLEEARKFKRWVTNEVLPALRKTGKYDLSNHVDSYMIEDPIERAQAWIEEQKKMKELELTTKVQAQQIAELKPKANYHDIVLQCKDLLPIKVIAKDYGKSAQWLNSFLNKKKVQYKQGRTWLLYQKYAENGYTSTNTHTYETKDGVTHTQVHTYWTQKGRLFIYDLLKSEGILPLIEKQMEEENDK